MEEVGGWRAGEQTELCNIGWLVGCPGDAQSEEFDALVLGVSNSRENVGVPRVGYAISEEYCYFDAAKAGFLQVKLGHVGNGVGGVGPVPDVDDGSYPGLEVLCPPPVFEGLLSDNVTTVLQQSHPQTQAAAGL